MAWNDIATILPRDTFNQPVSSLAPGRSWPFFGQDPSGIFGLIQDSRLFTWLWASGESPVMLNSLVVNWQNPLPKPEQYFPPSNYPVIANTPLLHLETRSHL